ncbi:MAG: ribosomal RNA small subunit methyltransferase I [Candidatus Parcubacteria bacterium]|nr:MAG: ribosomal RNA small subunit methyltransferase I [Candidatus Parcubacteria bacterium]
MRLFIVPTPIGNLKDITLRGIEVLKQVDYIFCEDTRRTKILLDHYEIKDKKLISYFAPFEAKKIPQLLEILKRNEAALVVDSGMPVISDPGYKLIKACLENSIEIEVLPGPTAFLTALIGSGLPLDKFLFLGFLPKKGLENYFRKIKDLEVTIAFYESPKRISKTLEVIRKVFGNCQVVIAREVSKIYEEYLRGDIEEIIEKLKDKKLKGEITVIIRRTTHNERRTNKNSFIASYQLQSFSAS